MTPATSEHMFGVSREKPTRAAARRMRRIAAKHGAVLVEATIPGTGYQRWYACRNRGEPFDSATARAVLDEIEGRGQTPPTASS